MVNVHWISVWLSDYQLVRYSAAYRQRGVEAAKTRGRNLSKHPTPDSVWQTDTCRLGFLVERHKHRLQLHMISSRTVSSLIKN